MLFENIKIFSVTCFVLFLLPFEIWESILPHPVLTAFPRQQWLRQRASVQPYTYVACLVFRIAFFLVLNVNFKIACLVEIHTTLYYLHVKSCIQNINISRR